MDDIDYGRVVHVFDESVKSFPFTQNNRVTTYNDMGPADAYTGDIDFGALDNHFGTQDMEPGWNEKIVTLENSEVLENYSGQDLEFDLLPQEMLLLQELNWFLQIVFTKWQQVLI
tara:strand:+ start:644 stop:988 length:345 start_codon:yes stop_codon:yes gene_type:complete